MTWLIPIATTVLGSVLNKATSDKNAKAVSNAAGAQTASDQAAIDENRRQFDVTQGNLAPWLAAGKAALGQQSALLGLGNLTAAPGGMAAPTVGGYNIQKLLADPAYADVAQWVQAGHGDPNATGPQTPEQAVNYWVQNGISQGDPRAINAPRYTADDVATAGNDPNSPQAQQQAAIDQLKGSPIYQSLYRNGQDAILANGSATGGLRGGNIQRSLANFGSDTLASVIQDQLSRLGGISGQGVTTATNEGQLGANASTIIGNLTVGQGQDRAGGILGSSALRNQGNAQLLQSLLQAGGQLAGHFGGMGGGSPI